MVCEDKLIYTSEAVPQGELQQLSIWTEYQFEHSNN